MKKAAVIIGVSKAGNLTPLNSAIESANEIASWLSNEGFDVDLFTDEDNTSVTTAKIKKTIKKYVTSPPTYDQFLIYFSGHGYWHAAGDFWLLSGNPIEDDEVINLSAAKYSARFAGIPHVIFISDACRSIPDTSQGINLRGIGAFPNFSHSSSKIKIDSFQATSEGTAAYEVKSEGKYISVLTHAFTSAYEEATEDMVADIDDKKVVLNRRLEDYLRRKVRKILAEVDFELVQDLDINVPSSDEAYIAKYTGLPHEEKETTRGSLDDLVLENSQPTTIFQDVSNSLTQILSGENTNYGRSLSFKNSATRHKFENHLPIDISDDFSPDSGFIVYGSKVLNVVCTDARKGTSAELSESNDGMFPHVKVAIEKPNQNNTSVLIRLEDGRGIVIPALTNFLGYLFIDENGLENVSYIPTSDNYRWDQYKKEKQKIDSFRALTSIAIKNNVFKISNKSEARKLASLIRTGKAIEPTLGLYAAHAYYQANEDENVLNVKNFMEDEINTIFFDLRVMTYQLEDNNYPEISTPFCPLLTQTWNILGAANIQLDPLLVEASRYLTNSLWTTFEEKGADLIEKYIDKENNQ